MTRTKEAVVTLKSTDGKENCKLKIFQSQYYSRRFNTKNRARRAYLRSLAALTVYLTVPLYKCYINAFKYIKDGIFVAPDMN